MADCLNLSIINLPYQTAKDDGNLMNKYNGL